MFFAVGPAQQHQPKNKGRNETKRRRNKLVFSQGFGAFWGTGLSEEEANKIP